MRLRATCTRTSGLGALLAFRSDGSSGNQARALGAYYASCLLARSRRSSSTSWSIAAAKVTTWFMASQPNVMGTTTRATPTQRVTSGHASTRRGAARWSSWATTSQWRPKRTRTTRRWSPARKHIPTDAVFRISVFLDLYKKAVWQAARPKGRGAVGRQATDPAGAVHRLALWAGGLVHGRQEICAAVDQAGCCSLPVSCGFFGQRRREMAYGFGVRSDMTSLLHSRRFKTRGAVAFRQSEGAQGEAMKSSRFSREQIAHALRSTGWRTPISSCTSRSLRCLVKRSAHPGGPILVRGVQRVVATPRSLHCPTACA